MANLEYLYLYDDPDSEGLDTDYLAHWVAGLLPDTRVAVRADFLTLHLSRFSEQQRDEITPVLSARLEQAEVGDLVHPRDRGKLPELPPSERGLDVVYEAEALQAVLRLLIPEDESPRGRLHIAFTANYLGVWRDDEAYLCLRPTALGLPNLISTSGLVEALELPKKYHFMRQQLAILGIEEDLDGLFAEETLAYGDPRLNEICKGYILEAIFFHLAGEIGCADPDCRLHITGSHVETLRTQVQGSGTLCERHRELWQRWGGVPE
jgi:hypothetical protein